MQKGLEVIQNSNIKDDWINEKADLLNQLQRGLDAEKNRHLLDMQADAGRLAEDKKDMDEIFGDKKKW